MAEQSETAGATAGEEPPELVETPVESVAEMVAATRQSWSDCRSLPLAYRLEQLRALKRMLEENEAKFEEALWKDLRKSPQECHMSELNGVRSDLNLALQNLHKWMSPHNVEKDLLHQFNKAFLLAEPYGTVLIIAPWNYPVGLSIQPLIGAIAAGNACILKPSEISVSTSNLLRELLPQYLDKDLYKVVTGGVEVSKEVLKQRFDYILCTGSPAVGKIVMRHAAEHLTPCTLELGGKCPAIVADDAHIEVAARRIAWGKCINAGQTCLSPDYVLCTERVRDRLIEACKTNLREFYGEDVKSSKDFGRIINHRHYQRLLSMLDGVRDKVVFGGETDESERFISPTLVSGVGPEDSVMKDEIFGPILPFVTVENMDKAIAFVVEREKPLALYLFTENQQLLHRVIQRTSAGGVTHNDTLLHFSLSSLPFGGVGQSGFGAYHGRFSFDTFSHYKPVLSTATSNYLENVNNIRYPPYSGDKMGDCQKLQLPADGVGGGTMKAFRLMSLVLQGATGHRPHEERRQ